jgi:hypothetical protein
MIAHATPASGGQRQFRFELLAQAFGLDAHVTILVQPAVLENSTAAVTVIGRFIGLSSAFRTGARSHFRNINFGHCPRHHTSAQNRVRQRGAAASKRFET